MRRLLASLGIGFSVVTFYFLVCLALFLLVMDDLQPGQKVPAYDIGLRLPTNLFKYLFPSALSDFYTPSFTLKKVAFAVASFLMNVVIYSLPFYAFLWFRGRGNKSELAETTPPPPPTFDD